MQILKFIKVFIISIVALIFSPIIMAANQTVEIDFKSKNPDDWKTVKVFEVDPSPNVIMGSISPAKGSEIPSGDSKLTFQVPKGKNGSVLWIIGLKDASLQKCAFILKISNGEKKLVVNSLGIITNCTGTPTTRATFQLYEKPKN